MAGKRIAASSAIIATTHTISRSVNPSSPAVRSLLPARDVGSRPAAAFLAVRPQRKNVIGAVLARRSIDIWLSPWIKRDNSALEIRTIPVRIAAGRLHQGRQALGRRWITTGVEAIEIQRAGDALNLNLPGLRLGFRQIVDHARADQGHDQSDDRDYDKHFDQRKTSVGPPARPKALRLAKFPPLAPCVPPLVNQSTDRRITAQSSRKR